MESCTWLHRDDTKLIFFVNPDKESLGLIVEDTTTIWPITIEVASFEETISFPKNIAVIILNDWDFKEKIYGVFLTWKGSDQQ